MNQINFKTDAKKSHTTMGTGQNFPLSVFFVSRKLLTDDVGLLILSQRLRARGRDVAEQANSQYKSGAYNILCNVLSCGTHLAPTQNTIKK